MRRSLPSALALCLCLLLSACAPRTETSHSGGSAAQPPEGGSSSQTEPQAPSGSGAEGPEEPEELPVEGDYAPEELPLFDKGFGWLCPALVGLIAGLAVRACRTGKAGH